MEGADLTAMQVETAAGSTTLRVGSDPAAYLASNPEIATEFGTSDAAVELV